MFELAVSRPSGRAPCRLPARLARGGRPRWPRRPRRRRCARVRRSPAPRAWRVDAALPDGGGDPLEIRVPRGSRRPRRRDARPRGARRTRASFAIPRRPVSARSRGRRGTRRRRSRSPTSQRGVRGQRALPVAAFVGGAVAVMLRTRSRALGPARARRRDPRPRRRDRRGVLHRVADVRPAAERGDAAAGVLVDPRKHSEHGLVGRRSDPPLRRRRDRRDPRAPRVVDV